MLLIPRAFQAAQIIYIRSNTQDSPYTALRSHRVLVYQHPGVPVVAKVSAVAIVHTVVDVHFATGIAGILAAVVASTVGDFSCVVKVP
jgi:hypothetical protein